MSKQTVKVRGKLYYRSESIEQKIAEARKREALKGSGGMDAGEQIRNWADMYEDFGKRVEQ